MPVDLSFVQVAAFGAIVSVLLVLVVLALVGWGVFSWVRGHASRFKKLGIERTDEGHVQFSGFLHGKPERRTQAFMDRVFGPSRFEPREDEQPPQEDIPSA